jgi:hypothetical protein
MKKIFLLLIIYANVMTAQSIKELNKLNIIFIKFKKDNSAMPKRTKINMPNYEENGFYFGSTLFPTDTFDLKDNKKMNFRKIMVFNRKKSFLIKNKSIITDFNLIDKQLKTVEEYNNFWMKKRKLFIIDLDESEKDEFKIYKVGKPTIVVY